MDAGAEVAVELTLAGEVIASLAWFIWNNRPRTTVCPTGSSLTSRTIISPSWRPITRISRSRPRNANGSASSPTDRGRSPRGRAESLSPKIYGYQHITCALVLASVGGSRAVYPTGDADRGDFHVLLLGDPGTAKSKLGDSVADIMARSVSVGASDVQKTGLTTVATRDDFGDG